jgi:hypothetical protein
LKLDSLTELPYAAQDREAQRARIVAAPVSHRLDVLAEHSSRNLTFEFFIIRTQQRIPHGKRRAHGDSRTIRLVTEARLQQSVGGNRAHEGLHIR